MGAPQCEKCQTLNKTYWVNDSIWLCAKCFKEAKGR